MASSSCPEQMKYGINNNNFINTYIVPAGLGVADMAMASGNDIFFVFGGSVSSCDTDLNRKGGLFHFKNAHGTHHVGDPGREFGLENILGLSPVYQVIKYQP